MMEKIGRRGFFKACGGFLLGLGILPAVEALAGSGRERFLPGPEALGREKWGLVVDMKQCWEKGRPGCRDCIVACHRAHNVPEIPDPEEEVKWIWTEAYGNAFPGLEHPYLEGGFKDKPFLVLCNHCANPPCVRVCPSGATFQAKDGLVMMDYHRCLGCRFCMAACPFGARSFNFRDPRPFIREEQADFPTREKGVVEKCNFCAERLARGSLPACVEACKEGALVFGDLADPRSQPRKILGSRYAIRRKPELGTEPKVFYLV